MVKNSLSFLFLKYIDSYNQECLYNEYNAYNDFYHPKKHNNRGLPVICIETGEVYKNAPTAGKILGLN